MIGVSLEDAATVLSYELAANERIINGFVGPHPVTVAVSPYIPAFPNAWKDFCPDSHWYNKR